jgi:hypothetical protein
MDLDAFDERIKGRIQAGNFRMDWWHPLAWDWATLAKSALGAGFGTAAMTGILSVYRDMRHRK